MTELYGRNALLGLLADEPRGLSFNPLAEPNLPSPYSKGSETDRKVWAWVAAEEILGLNRLDYRRDCDGRVIAWAEYGQYSDSGWHIDHVEPLALGGADILRNLRARHWRGNTRAGGLLGSLFA